MVLIHFMSPLGTSLIQRENVIEELGNDIISSYTEACLLNLVTTSISGRMEQVDEEVVSNTVYRGRGPLHIDYRA